MAKRAKRMLQIAAVNCTVIGYDRLKILAIKISKADGIRALGLGVFKER
jgi:hypothetical protein